MGLYAGGAHVCGNFFRDFRIRSEQPLQSFQIKNNCTWRCVFHAWREYAGAIEQRGMSFIRKIGNVNAGEHKKFISKFEIRISKLKDVFAGNEESRDSHP